MILASRLSDDAADGEILVSQRVFAALEDRVEAHRLEPLALKGFTRPVAAYAVHGLRDG